MLAGGPGGRCRRVRASGVRRGRKVRTPQGSVPDNVRDADFKVRGRPVPQKRYRLGYPFSRRKKRVVHDTFLAPGSGHPEPPEGFARPARTPAEVRVKWCGKSSSWSQTALRIGPMRPGGSWQLPKPPGRSLMSVRGNAAPRGMTAHDRIRLTGPFAELTTAPAGKVPGRG